MRAFVTVGSTRFDSLVQAVLSPLVLEELQRKGYQQLVVQCGNSHIDGFGDEETNWAFDKAGVEARMWRFKPSLEEDYNEADLVISHAGSGTILDVLRKGKLLIVVPNPTLLDNHQEELAEALSKLGHLKSSTIGGLPQAINYLDKSALVPFPPFDGSRFQRLMDEEMGFV
ncbi:glycosyltransferase 28 [Dentipellis sp. KUC8613]|nr:glycosyltransferase 28 [Dentipellis sp. KUC8613]